MKDINTARISIVEARIRITKQYPLDKSFSDSTMGPFHTFSLATIYLRDSDGFEGEVYVYGSGLKVLTTKLLPILLNNTDCLYTEIFNKMYWAIRNDGFRSTEAILLGQVDHAIHDVLSRRANKPLHRYWGADRDWAHVYGSGLGTNYSLEELEKEAASFVEKGYDTVKMKIGKDAGTQVAEDVKRVQLVRKTLGDNVKLALDANQTFVVEQALDFANRVADQNITWFEEPINAAAFVSIRELCEKSPIDISYGESERTVHSFPSLLESGVKHFQPILGSMNIREWFQVAKMAEENKIFFSSGGISYLAAQGVAACHENNYTEILNPIIESCVPYLSLFPTINEGRFYLPTEVGSSVRFNWEKVEKEGLLEFDKIYTKADLQECVIVN